MTQPDKLKVLFLCAGNACRSPMAEAIARASAADVLEVRSAGLFPFGKVMDLTKQVLTARGVPCEGLTSKSVAETAPFRPDLIVNMSGWPVNVQGAGGARPFLKAPERDRVIDTILGHVTIGGPLATCDRKQTRIVHVDGVVAGESRCLAGV